MKHTKGKIYFQRIHVREGKEHFIKERNLIDLESLLNEFYDKYIILPGCHPTNSKRYICHDHTEDLARKLGITLKEIKS